MKMSKTALAPVLLSLTTITFLTTQPVFAQGFVPGGGGGGFDGSDIHQLGQILVNIINFLLTISGMVVIVLIVIGGIRMVLSAGDPKAMQAARHGVTFAIFGLILILLAVLIVNVLGNFLGVSNLNQVRIGF